jgi:hypothetical protein
MTNRVLSPGSEGPQPVIVVGNLVYHYHGIGRQGFRRVLGAPVILIRLCLFGTAYMLIVHQLVFVIDLNG